MSGKSLWLRRLLWLNLIAVTVAPLWLFLSNADQLFPSPVREATTGQSWRNERLKPEFAGGFWHKKDFWRSVNISVISATLTAFFAALIGIPAAWALSRYRIPGKAMIETLFAAIMVLPASSVGLALILMFQYGPLRRLQDSLGHQVMYSIFPGVVIAQSVLALAVGISAWRSAFEAVNPRMEHIARTLGASTWQAFRKVTLPLAFPGLLAGFILAWIRAMAEFGAVLLFCGTFRELPLTRFGTLSRALHIQQADLLSIAMWTEIEYGNIEYGFGIAFALAIICATCVYVIHALGGRGYVWR